MIKDFFDNHNYIYEEEKSLKNLNTYKIDTIAKYIVYPKSEEQLIELLKFIKSKKIKYYILGNGSNVIFSMNYYNGVIIKLSKLDKIKYNKNEVTVQAGYLLMKLSKQTIEKGYSGFEFSMGIPGCVGASVSINAGAYNKDISSILKEVKVLNPNFDIEIMKKDELDFSYRDSFLKKNSEYIVLEVTFILEKGNISEMKKIVSERQLKRIQTQPLEYPSAGSVFRNPDGLYAGKLIEDLSLKGYQINDAKISNKHANFIINTGNATGKDIIKLINIVKEKVKKEYGIELILEQIIVE